MNKTRVRVEMKKLPLNASRQERERSVAILLRIFKKMCENYGIQQECREREFFQRPCDVRRRKRQQAQLMARTDGASRERGNRNQQEMEW